jgi:hypothetical protein
MGNRLYFVFAVVAVVLVIAWHIADEAGMPKDVRLYSAYIIVGLVVLGTVIQAVRAATRRRSSRPTDNAQINPDPPSATQP